MEKKFLRMLVVVDAPVPDKNRNDGGDGGGGDGGGGGNSGDRNGLYPCTKSGSLQRRHRPLSRGRRITGSCQGGGPCIVGCKFVTEVERFNKGGLEADYTVMKYGRKVDCLRLPDNVSKEAGTKQRAGGGGGRMPPVSFSPACVG